MKASGWAFSISSSKNNRIGTAAHCFGKLSALFVAHISGRCAHQPADVVPLHELAHVQLDERLFAAKEELGQNFGQLRLADAGRAQEDEAADGALWILQPGASAPHRLADRLDRFILADDPFMELFFHSQQPLPLFTAHSIDRHTGPHRDDLGDIVGGDDGLVGYLAPAFAQLLELRLQLDLAVAQIDGIIEALRFERLFLFLLQALEIDEGLAQAYGVRRLIHTYAAAGLVDQVDSLVRHEAVGDIARGQMGGGVERIVRNDELVVLLIAALYALQNLNRLLNPGLFDQNWLESPLQRGIALDMFAVLVERRGAYHLQLAAAERGLEDIGGVDTAAGRARAHQHVHFVDEREWRRC